MTVWVVVRASHAVYERSPTDSYLSPGLGVPVAAFATRAAARAEAKRLTAEARTWLRPSRLYFYDTGTVETVRTLIDAYGLRPPKSADADAIRQWWEANAAVVPPGLADAVWAELVSRQPLFTVSERELA